MNASVFYTPTEVLERFYKNGYDVVKLKGTVVRDNGKLYLSDGNARIELDEVQGVEVPTEGDVEVVGQVVCYPYPKGGGVYVHIKPKEVKPLDGREFFEKVKEAELEPLLRQKVPRGLSYFIELGQRGKEVNIALLYGKNAQTHGDFLKALKETLGNLNLPVRAWTYETSLKDAELAKAIRSLNQVADRMDFAIIVRGGGAKEELSKVGGIESAKAILESPLPFYLALGHTFDKGLSLLEKVVDYSFATPSMAGAEIGRMLRIGYLFSTLASGSAFEEKVQEKKSFWQSFKETLEGLAVIALLLSIAFFAGKACG